MSRRKLQINEKHCKYTELESAYDKCQDPTMKTKLLAILQTWDGLTSTDVAKNLHKSDFCIRSWIHKYNADGINGLKDARSGNRPSYLSE